MKTGPNSGIAGQLSPPFFIVGAPRSGTTLLSRILDHHSRIAVYPESHYYPLFRADLDLYGDLRQPPNLQRFIEDVGRVTQMQGAVNPAATEEFLEALVQPSFEGVLATLLQIHARKQGKVRCGEKTPGHHAYLDEMLERFPDSPVIFVLRDPRDTVLSIRRAFGTSLKGAAWMWNQAFMSYHRFSHQVHLVRYEELVREPRKTVEAVCAVLGEPFEFEMFRFFERIPDRLASLPNFSKLLKAVDADSVGNFRQMSRHEVQWVEAACAEGMEALAYPFTMPPPKPLPISAPTKLDFLLDRLRYYGRDWRRWRRGWMRWKIVLRLRIRYFLSLRPLVCFDTHKPDL